jgi:GT2 family glycosyltransferase
VPHTKPFRTVVAIPVKNEEQHIGRCLAALARQSEVPDDVLLLLNNTADGTSELAARMSPRLGSRLHVMEVDLPASHAHAGYARQLAMAAAADLAGGSGVVLTTDADACVPVHWVARTLAWLRAGHDAVCGMAVIDPEDEATIPAHLLADDMAETRYTELLDEIDHLVDPRPGDPWPRHTHRSGASIGVRAAVFTAVGGLPEVSHGEDRAFIARLEARDCKIRHDPGIVVRVSGRRVGRAEGGMAATIARRVVAQDFWADERLEMPQAALRRAQLRTQARAVWKGNLDCRFLAMDLEVRPTDLAAMVRSAWFGLAWASIEAASPILARRAVAMRQLRSAIREAERIVRALREDGQPMRSALDKPWGETEAWVL